MPALLVLGWPAVEWQIYSGLARHLFLQADVPPHAALFWSRRRHFSGKGLLDELLMAACCPAAIDTRISPDRGLETRVPKKLFDGLVFSRVLIEHALRAQVPKLMRR